MLYYNRCVKQCISRHTNDNGRIVIVSSQSVCYPRLHLSVYGFFSLCILLFLFGFSFSSHNIDNFLLYIYLCILLLCAMVLPLFSRPFAQLPSIFHSCLLPDTVSFFRSNWHCIEYILCYLLETGLTPAQHNPVDSIECAQNAIHTKETERTSAREKERETISLDTLLQCIIILKLVLMSSFGCLVFDVIHFVSF